MAEPVTQQLTLDDLSPPGPRPGDVVDTRSSKDHWIPAKVLAVFRHTHLGHWCFDAELLWVPPWYSTIGSRPKEPWEWRIDVAAEGVAWRRQQEGELNERPFWEAPDYQST